MTTHEIHAGRAALALAWVCACASTAPAAPRAPPACDAQSDQAAAFDELMRLLATRRHGHVRFEELHQIAMLERPLESSGELVYEAPDHLEERTLAPRVETLVLDHGVLTARRGSRSTTLPLREYPQVAPFVAIAPPSSASFASGSPGISLTGRCGSRPRIRPSSAP
ncbi:MAG: hypothetical protein E6K23_14635 [Gammaproteobacteria bacterium]|nr:MAG: hypothetical protein E6K23_14635 [Gammaproteobacteria bacterium]